MLVPARGFHQEGGPCCDPLGETGFHRSSRSSWTLPTNSERLDSVSTCTSPHSESASIRLGIRLHNATSRFGSTTRRSLHSISTKCRILRFRFDDGHASLSVNQSISSGCEPFGYDEPDSDPLRLRFRPHQQLVHDRRSCSRLHLDLAFWVLPYEQHDSTATDVPRAYCLQLMDWPGSGWILERRQTEPGLHWSGPDFVPPLDHAALAFGLT